MSISELIECPICNDIFNTVTETPCCHKCFCKECLFSWLVKSSSCPECRSSITSSQCTSNLPIQRLVDNQKAECPFSGCTDSITRGNLNDHKNICEYSLVQCKWNTQTDCPKIIKKNITQHEIECTYRMIDCPKDCKVQVIFRELESHYRDCLNYEVECEECHQLLQRRDLTKHVSSACPERIILCPFQTIDCTATIKSKDLVAHLQTHAQEHLDLALSKYEACEKEKLVLRQKVDELMTSLKDYQKFCQEHNSEVPHSPLRAFALHLPSSLNRKNVPSIVRFTNELTVSFGSNSFFKGSSIRAVSGNQQAYLVCADRPVSNVGGLYYFEITIENEGTNKAIGIGFSESHKQESMPGWHLHSYGYHADDGRKFGNGYNGLGEDYGTICGTGNVMGCGWDQSKKNIFFTKNGQTIGPAFTNVQEDRLFPVIGLHSLGCIVTVNLGGRAFCY